MVCVRHGGGITELSMERASHLPGRGLAVTDLLFEVSEGGAPAGKDP